MPFTVVHVFSSYDRLNKWRSTPEARALIEGAQMLKSHEVVTAGGVRVLLLVASEMSSVKRMRGMELDDVVGHGVDEDRGGWGAYYHTLIELRGMIRPPVGRGDAA